MKNLLNWFFRKSVVQPADDSWKHEILENVMKWPNAETNIIDLGIIAGSTNNEIFYIEAAKIPPIMEVLSEIRHSLSKELTPDEKLTEMRKLFQHVVRNDTKVINVIATDKPKFEQFKKKLIQLRR